MTINRGKNKFFEKNSELSLEFSRYVLDHPELDESLKPEITIVFLPEYDPELKDFNLNMARDLEAEGVKIVFVKVRQMSPKITSRLVGVELAAGASGAAL